MSNRNQFPVNENNLKKELQEAEILHDLSLA